MSEIRRGEWHNGKREAGMMWSDLRFNKITMFAMLSRKKSTQQMMTDQRGSGESSKKGLDYLYGLKK